MMLATIAAPATPPIAPPMAAAMIVVSDAGSGTPPTITPNTFQPLPRTSSWLRPKASSAPRRSATIAGAPTDQIVIRYRPGTISRMKPMPTAIPERIANTIRDAERGHRGGDELADGRVATAVADVLDELDDETGVEVGGDQLQDRGEELEDEPALLLEHADDDPEGDSHREADSHERRRSSRRRFEMTR